MQTFLIILHFIVTILLMIVILLQSSKGGGLAGVFGGGGAMGTVFGGRGAASFLSKVTTVLAAIFLGLALLISYIDKGRSVDSELADEMRKRSEMESQSAPAAIAPLVQPEGQTSSSAQPNQPDTK
ncbi:MAG: preprotein translocase subunit SecG [candidate division KSB1 bacterium]|nr:preprotein translocase subunit SecG [candidate division KSB1 bacterium]MDZ7336054.1 preprotein translocase subunit SecG [candidate division KSB1 bacterium]MDZ7358058.1 preprotein translocase subunit SecG [candidate division KSB1 bacterium]MDZ7402239.1 preprotein translocase subunit SecG [candidate division KSB1 bacterium]